MFHLREPARGGQALLLPDEGSGGRHVAAAPVEQRDDESRVTDAQRLAIDRNIAPDPRLVGANPERMGFFSAARYVLSVRTNVALIVSGALGYYFLAGVQTFGVEFVRDQYSVDQALANLLMLVVGGGAAVGILIGGPLGDRLLRRGYLKGRVLVPAVAATLTVVLFIPALITRSPMSALPYLILAAAALSAQNPPIDAARLDIMPALLWGLSLIHI